MVTDLTRIFDVFDKLADGNVPPFKIDGTVTDGANCSSRTNPTVLPDEHLRDYQTVFLIRHPRLAVYSFMKAMRDARPETYRTDFALYLGAELRLVSDVYQWVSSEASSGRGPKPIVIDAEDIVNGSGAVQKLCDMTGLEMERILYQWEAMAEEDIAKLPGSAKRFMSEINRSTGILKTRNNAPIDSEEEKKMWIDELGREDAETLERFVRQAMPHYEHMYARRLHA